MATEGNMRGVDHRGERYVHLDDLILLAQQVADVWAGHDAADAIEEMIRSLADWSLTMPGGDRP